MRLSICMTLERRTMNDHPIVEAKIWNRTTKAFDIKSGRFHGYGFDFEEFENGAVQVSIAIVERLS